MRLRSLIEEGTPERASGRNTINNDLKELADFESAPGVPEGERVGKKRGADKLDRGSPRVRLPKLSPDRAAPASPMSDLSNLSDAIFASNDASEGAGDGKPSAAGPRGRGRGVGAGGLGDGGGTPVPLPAHLGAAAASGVGLGRGRGGARAAGPVAPRGSQQTPWGRPGWSLSLSDRGCVADCRCHHDLSDVSGISTHCRKNLTLRQNKTPTTIEEARRLAKVWLLCGESVAAGGIARSNHVGTDPRCHFVGKSEAELDALAAALV